MLTATPCPVYELGANGKWKRPTIYRDKARVRALPFDAIEINLADLWAE